jgi:hypothetical protein
VDWTQRRPHLAGALPAALVARFVELGWMSRGRGRLVRVADDDDDHPERWLGPS